MIQFRVEGLRVEGLGFRVQGLVVGVGPWENIKS